MRSVAPSRTIDRINYPDSDGEPMAETEAHILLMLSLIGTLRGHFKKRGNVYVIGNMFLYYEKGNPQARKAPDVMVVKGVDARTPRRSFKTWQEKAVPCVIFELTSEETAGVDLGEKRRVYEELGVREYFLFDPLSDYLPQQLMGFRLAGGKYQAIKPDENHSLVSKELGMRLVPNGRQLDLILLKTGEKVLAPEESLALWENVRQDLEAARDEAVRIRMELDKAENRIHKLEEENRRLRGE